MARATPRTPALLPAQGRQRDGPRQGDPPPHWPPRPHSRGARRTAPPPPAHPPAAEGPGRASPTHGERTAPSQVGGETGPGCPPPKKQTTRGTVPGQDKQRGTDRVERPYQRPAPGLTEVRAPDQPGEGGGRTPRERRRTHTQRTRGEYQKGNRTEPAERTDRVEWRTSERG